MTINVAINGFGRIGRNVFRANYESGNNSEINIVAINDLGDTEINAHLLKYDTAHGPFGKSVQIKNNKIIALDVGAQGGFNSDCFFPKKYNNFFEEILIEPIKSLGFDI